jgi:large subunit ribosomal protein L18
MGNVRMQKLSRRKRRHLRIRKKILGTAERPRLSVKRSLKHIEAQLIDDSAGRSLMGLSSNSVALREKLSGVQGKLARGREVGRLLASNAREAGIQQVVFDRGGYLYHGRVKALAEGAREGGLKF